MFDEKEEVEMGEFSGEEIQKDLQDTTKYEEYINNNILNILALKKEEKMLEIYSEITIKKRKGKILEQLKEEKEDYNMYLISVVTDVV